jgi:TfoX/Sxy family transcriptional regulator of competence genes
MPRATSGKAEIVEIDAVVARLRAALPRQGVSERRMFGGVYFMLNGNMTVGVSRRGMLVRVGKERQDDAVARGARPADMKGRPMEGYVRVDPAGLADAALKDWVGRAVAFVRTLPARPDQPKLGRSKPKKTK